jgi:hypothetical protein
MCNIFKEKFASLSTSKRGTEVGYGGNQNEMTNLPLKNIIYNRRAIKTIELYYRTGNWD